MAQLFALGLGLSLGHSISDVIWFWLLLIIAVVVILIFDNHQDKKKLQIIKNLPKTVPFITINHQNVRVYDVFGKELVAVPIDEIVGLYVIRRGGSLHISDKKSWRHDFSYAVGLDELGTIYYFDHQNKKYTPESLIEMCLDNWQYGRYAPKRPDRHPFSFC